MSGEKSSSKSSDIYAGFITKICLVTLKLLVLVLTARAFGAEGRGTYVALISLVGISINLSALGLGDALLQRFAKRSLSPFSYKPFLFLAICITSVFGLLMLNIFLFFNVNISISVIMLLIVHFLIPIATTELFTSLCLRGLGKHSIVNRISLVSRFSLVVILSCSFWLNLDTVTELLFVYLFVSFLTSAAFLIFLLKVNEGRLRFKKFIRRIKLLILRGIQIHPVNVLLEFENRLDVLLLIYFSSPVAVGIYLTGVSFAQAGFYVSNSITSILTTNFGKEASSDASDIAVKAQRFAFAILSIASIPSLVFTFLIIEFIIGVEFADSFLITVVLTIGVLFDSSTRIIAAWSKGQLVSKFFIKISLYTWALNLLICLIMLERFGPFGLAVGSAIGYFVRSIFYVRRFRLISKNKKTILPSPETYRELGIKLMHLSLTSMRSILKI